MVIIYRASSLNITSIWSKPFIIFIYIYELHLAELFSMAGSLEGLIVDVCKFDVTECVIYVSFFLLFTLFCDTVTRDYTDRTCFAKQLLALPLVDQIEFIIFN